MFLSHTWRYLGDQVMLAMQPGVGRKQRTLSTLGKEQQLPAGKQRDHHQYSEPGSPGPVTPLQQFAGATLSPVPRH